jgi:hypothetical protein
MRPLKLAIALWDDDLWWMAAWRACRSTVVLTVDERGEGVVDFGFGNVAFGSARQLL